jgi:hypothetical protein
MTSRMLPRIEPMIEALTTSWSPALRANNAMISSGALPNVTFRKPPIPGPDLAATSSVARPMSAAVGITPAAAAKKMRLADAWVSSRTIASGMAGTSRYGQPCALRRKLQLSRGPCPP